LEREDAWDDAHSGETSGEVEMGNSTTERKYPVCVTMKEAFDVSYQTPTIDDSTWWDRPGSMVSNATPTTPLRAKRPIVEYYFVDRRT
jgi:hypothetical protein